MSPSYNNQQRDFMRRAIELSSMNLHTGDGGPFGAVIVREGEIIAEGRNMVIVTGDPTAHAEIVAIREACRRLGRFHLTGCTIYASCEPCPMCLGAIHWARLDSIHYSCSRDDAAAIGFDDSFIYRQIELPPEERALVTVQLMRDEAVEVFQLWDAMERKIRY